MKLSVVIPSYNGKLLLEKNLPAVILAVNNWDQGHKWEVVVVDDASTDGTIEWLTQNYPSVKVVKNKNNLRFAKSCNRGVSQVIGDVVLLLNNDVKPQKNFLSHLLTHFSDESVFAVGCRELNMVDGQVKEGGRGVSRFNRGLVIHWRPEDQKNPNVTWISGGSAAFNKNIWDKLGGFDELFRPVYEEDRDLCWRALKSGYKIVFEPKAIVEHFHETTNLKLFSKTKISNCMSPVITTYEQPLNECVRLCLRLEFLFHFPTFGIGLTCLG